MNGWCSKHEGGRHCWHKVGRTGFSGRYESSFEVQCCHCREKEHQRISDPIAQATIDRLEHELAQWQKNCTGHHGSQMPCGTASDGEGNAKV